jgi:hypothetical protein
MLRPSPESSIGDGAARIAECRMIGVGSVAPGPQRNFSEIHLRFLGPVP